MYKDTDTYFVHHIGSRARGMLRESANLLFFLRLTWNRLNVCVEFVAKL